MSTLPARPTTAATTAAADPKTARTSASSHSTALITARTNRILPDANQIAAMAINPAISWTNCETLCRARLGVVASAEACVFSTLGNVGQAQDGTRQQYAVIYNGGNFASGSSWVQRAGAGGSLYDVQVVIGWRDDDPLAVLPQNTPCGGAVHCVTLRNSIYRGVGP